MDFILNAFGNILVLFYQLVQPFVLSIVLFALMVRIIFVVIFTRYYKNINLGEALQPEIEKLQKKHKKHPEKLSNELPALLLSKGYSMFGNIIHFLTNGLFAIALGLTLMDFDKYLNVNGEPIPMMFFNLPLYLSPGNIILSGDYSRNLFLYAAIIFLTAAGLHTMLDKFLQEHSLMDVKRTDTLLLILLLVGCFTLPLGVSIFWIAVKTMDIIHIALVRKFYKVDLEKINKLQRPVRKRNKK